MTHQAHTKCDTFADRARLVRGAHCKRARDPERMQRRRRRRTDVTIGQRTVGDPVTLDFPVFYVKRPVPDPEDDDVMETDARELNRFEIGADLFMRDRRLALRARNQSHGTETRGLGDIRDLDVNFDGTKLLFSMRARFIENADEEDQPTWNIWEYDTTTKALRRIIQSDNDRGRRS